MLESLFKPKQSERELCKEEVQRILKDLEVMHEACDTVPSQKSLEWRKTRLQFLKDETMHPIARLAATEDFDEMVLDYISKLREAAEGDARALKEVRATKKKTKALLAEEVKRAERKIEEIKDILRETVKWQSVRDRALEDRRVSQQRMEMLLPKDRANALEWKAYYKGRVKVLENDAIDVAARFLWVNHKKKTELVNEYFELLNQLVMGNEGKEKEFHKLEAMMDASVKREARRIREAYPDFFKAQ